MTPKPLLLADGTAAPFNLVVRVFEDTLHVKLYSTPQYSTSG